MERTQVGIVGAGPAGLMLAHLLRVAGIECVVLEHRDRAYVESRVRAGVLEHGAAELLRSSGVGGRMDREGLAHRGIYLQFAGGRHHLDFVELTGRGIVVYGQQEVVRDLIGALLHAGTRILFGMPADSIQGTAECPAIGCGGGLLECDFVACCDGSHGLGRDFATAAGSTTYGREYPYGWLGILARTPPASEELIYAYHEAGFALHSMRSPEVSRLYLQVGADEELKSWPEERIWQELRLRLGEPRLQAGEIMESGITAMRSMVLEPMHHGRVFLAGDAAHIVPPTGAKGMNLALADVQTLAAALAAWYRDGDATGLDAYSTSCLRRAWRSEHFSAFMTGMLHRDVAGDPFEHKLRLANLEYIVQSRAAARSLAENYTGAATGLTSEAHA